MIDHRLKSYFRGHVVSLIVAFLPKAKENCCQDRRRVILHSTEIFPRQKLPVIGMFVTILFRPKIRDAVSNPLPQGLIPSCYSDSLDIEKCGTEIRCC